MLALPTPMIRLLRPMEVEENTHHPHTTTTLLPAGVVAGSVVVRSAMSGNPSRRSKMTSHPVSNPNPAR